jgi:Holliday junction resolvase RusA-like endonuclease
MGASVTLFPLEEPQEDHPPECITLDVVGVPAPQGSKTAMVIGGHARVVEGTSASGRMKHKSWREGVTMAARDWLTEHPQPPLCEPVRVKILFRFPLPGSDKYRTRHAQTPDIDKILRSTFDALVVGGILKDDSFIYEVSATKLYAHGDFPVGASIRIYPCGYDEKLDREFQKARAKALRSARR